jgi:hypothetical protein
MRLISVIASLIAIAAASPVELEERQAKPDPNTVYVESTSSFALHLLTI